MWSQWMAHSWGYGGYGPFHLIIWIIPVIAAGRASYGASCERNRKKVILNSCSGTFALPNVCFRVKRTLDDPLTSLDLIGMMACPSPLRGDETA